MIHEVIQLEEVVTDGIVAVSRQYDQMRTWSLVLEAVRIPHKIENADDEWVLLVPLRVENRAKKEIAAYETENLGWPPPKVEEGFTERIKEPPTLLLFFLLTIFYGITGPWSNHSFWFLQGAASRVRIVDHGEWWRVVTALTLHADPAHLLGNTIIGGMIIHFLCRTLGAGWGSLLLILAGAFGNTLNILLRSGEHLSVGFSTAVFGAVGILSGLRLSRAVNLKRLLLPLGAGAGLLAFLGTEGEKTDLGAHLWGFLCGILLGGLAGMKTFDRIWDKDRPGIILPFLGVFVYLCWRLALANAP